MADVLSLRRSPLAGTSFGVAAPALTMAERAFRSLVEVRGDVVPDPGADPSVGDLHVWRLGPAWWLVDGPPADRPGLEVPLAAELRAAGGTRAVDVSAQRTTLELAGAAATTVLAHGCSIDLERVPVDGCVQGMLAGCQVAIGRVAAEEWRVYVRAAFARHLAAWLTDAAREYT